MRRADDAASFGECGVRLAAEDFGDAEVGDFHAALLVDQDVFGFDVAMDDAFVVGELQGSQICGTICERFARREFAGALQLAQVESVDEFHDEEGEAADLAEFMDGDDVGMVQPRQGAGFAVEAFGKAGAAGGLRRQDLQRDEPVERRLAGL